MVRFAVFTALLAGVSAASQIYNISNSDMTVSFDIGSNFGSISGIYPTSGPALLSNVDKKTLWSANFVSAEGESSVDSTTSAATSHRVISSSEVALTWGNIKITKSLVNVTITAKLEKSQMSLLLAFSSHKPDVSLWQYTITLNNILVRDSSSILENNGFGVIHDCDNNKWGDNYIAPACVWGSPIPNTYIPQCATGKQPCQSFSTLAIAKEHCSSTPTCTGVTHTAGGYEMRGSTATASSPSQETSWLITNIHECHPGAVSCGSFRNGYPGGTYQFMTAYDKNVANSGLYFGTHDGHAASKNFEATVQQNYGRSATLDFAISVTAADAGVPMTSHVVDFPFVIAVFDGDWWDSTQIYRQWVLPSADWTKKGPVEHRADVPKWLNNVTTWVNSHWQGYDIFNTTGGDPEVVKNRVLEVKQRFNLSGELGLHWYEWDTLGYVEGSNYTNCSRYPCGFDTWYPEYFPTRKGFSANLKEMQSNGVRVAPYINGRIFDIGVEKWQTDNAVQYAAKRERTPKMSTSPSKDNLGVYAESYGSHAQFNVMCPHTEYWQDVIASTAEKIVSQEGTDGVYIDEIAAAGDAPCWDPSHNHTLGGGSHWVSGYRAMLEGARKRVGNNAVFLTESNAEPFMDGVNIFLTLVGYSKPFSGITRIVNAFGSIYGGYYFSMGAEFFQKDFSNPDLFSAKIAKQLLYGSQLGWFSLGGRDDQPQQSPMGILNDLMDPQYDPEIHYLKQLSDAKILVNDWLVNGMSTRDLRVDTSGVNKTQSFRNTPRSSKDLTAVGTSFDNVMSGCFMREQNGVTTTICIITAVGRKTACKASFNMIPSKYGLPAGRTIQLSNYATKEVLGKYTNKISFSTNLASHEVLVLKFEAV